MRFLVFLGLMACFTTIPALSQTDALVGTWEYETAADGDLENNLLQLSPDGIFRWEGSLATNLDEFF